MTETTSTSLTPTRSEVERAVSFGVRAPSIHNTQPWHWVYRPAVLELHADRSRQLPALDPDGRSLLLSCGAALELARLGFAAAGWRTEVERLPDPEHPDLLARIHTFGRTALEPATVEPPLSALLELPLTVSITALLPTVCNLPPETVTPSRSTWAPTPDARIKPALALVTVIPSSSTLALRRRMTFLRVIISVLIHAIM